MARKIKTTGGLLQALDFRKNRNWIQDFYAFDTQRLERSMCEMGESYWNRAGIVRSLRLFHAMAKRVPAYKDYLKKTGVKPAKIQTFTDYKKLPTINKKNYIQKYSLEDRCWNGELSEDNIIAVSSGTSGEPAFWPRGEYQSFEQSIVHELLYRSWFDITNKKTLLLIAFPMGMYVSGIATTLPSWLVACKKYPVTIVSVGPQKNEIYKIVSLYERYDQVVLIGHPFFVKDVLETGSKLNIPWSKMDLKFMFCSEGFNEEWREHVQSIIGQTNKVYTMFNTYGSSEQLLIAYETPLSIQVRKIASENKDISAKIFSDQETPPNLFQYNPFLRFIESVKNELIVSSASGIPLVRYATCDRGNIHSYNNVVDNISSRTTPSLLNKSWQLPFVSLEGRVDNSIVFYAANIYPEHIRPAIDTPSLFNKVTGKILMRRSYNKQRDQVLNIEVEMRPNIKPTKALERNITKRVIASLKAFNAEYAHMSKHVQKDTKPKIHLRLFQDTKYFPPGKPKWVQRV